MRHVDAQRGGRSRLRAMAMLALVAVLVSACGPFSPDDEDPTSTAASIAQPTSAPDESTEAAATESPPTEAGDPASPAADSTPGASLATPDIPPFIRPDEDPATPPDGDTPFLSTPDVAGITNDEPAATTEADATEVTPVEFGGSDGTSGATPPGDGLGDVGTEDDQDEPSTADGTPSGTPSLAVLEETTTSDTIDLTSIDPVSVDNCEPADIPILIDGEAQFVTNSGVNFRTGPGSDCDRIGNGPLGAGVPVAVLSAPVVREDEQEYVWVQIRVNDITGWVIIDALDPAAS